MEDYRPNSHKYKEEKKIEKVATGKVQKKKKNEMSKFKEVFISEDVSNVKSYIFLDVLVPAIKKAILDIVTDGTDMILYGGSGSGRRRSKSDKVPYRDYFNRERDWRSDREYSVRDRFDYDDLTFDCRGDAEAVREQMEEVIDNYGVVTVADMYDMAGVTAPYTAAKYGWSNIRSAEVVRLRGGDYIIRLPRAMQID